MNVKNIILVVVIVLLSVGATLYFTKDEAVSPEKSTTDSSESAADETSVSEGLVLDYSNKGLTEFPKEILNQTSAVELNLSGNNLTGALPSEIAKLTKLEILNVSDNNMTGIPAEIGQLSRLRILNYADNQITGLPNELGKLKNLEVFDLSGNNPSQQDLSKIQSELPNSTQIIL